MLLQVAVRWLDTVSVESSQRIENTMLIIIYIGIVGMFFLDSRQMISNTLVIIKIIIKIIIMYRIVVSIRIGNTLVKDI